MATIRDVAQKANVHPSTVSRVFSGHTGISEATRQRVLATAAELGFQPNAIARSLSIQRTNTIGIVIPHVFDGFFEDSFFPQIMQGMLNVAYQHGFRLIVSGSQGHQDEFAQITQIMGSSQADGIVVMSSRLDVDTVGSLRHQKTPFVLLGHPPSEDDTDIAWVDADNQHATQQAIQHLLDLGHARIAYVGGDPEVMVTSQRQDAYQQALQAAGITPRKEWVDYGYFDEPGGYTAVQRMSILGQQAPTAYYAANDLMALGIIRALQEQGLRVPQDVSVIGTNDSPFAAYTTPPLSTITVPYAKMAGKAVELLIEQITNGRIAEKTHIIDCSLNLRGSTAAAP